MRHPVSLSFIEELFNYNYWARDAQLHACAAMTDEQFLCDLGSSYGSVRDTLVHMITVELLWLRRWRGQSSERMPFPLELQSLDAVSKTWEVVEREMRQFLATLDDEAIVDSVSYVSEKGDTFTYELWRPMLHLINHQSYHRGQVATLLRQLGLRPPAVDFLPGYRAGFRWF